MNRSTPGLPVHHQLPEFTQTHVHRVCDAILPSHPLLSPSPPAPIPPSIRVFSNESTLRMRWPKYWSFSFSIIPSNEHPGPISFRMDWLDLLAVQGTLKSLLQHHSSKASILRHSAFFTVQLSHLYMTTGKTIALTRWTFVGKVMSLLFNMLSATAAAAAKSLQLCPTLCGAMHSHKLNTSHELKRLLLLGRKVMTNLDRILESRDITLPTKVHLVKAMVFPVVMYGPLRKVGL